MAVSGMDACSMTMKRRMSTIESTCSTPTGHSWMQAPHVTQSQSASSETPVSNQWLGLLDVICPVDHSRPMFEDVLLHVLDDVHRREHLSR